VGATVVIALLLILRGFYQPFWVPSGSMMPALMPGDYILAAPSHSYVPKRGDIVVFKHTVADFDFVKRVVGLPGDRVQMRDGLLVLNGTTIPQTAMQARSEIKRAVGPAKHFPRCSNDPVGLGGECLTSQALEAMPGANPYPVLNIETNGFGDNTAEFTVPAGSYFFLGDNRDNSLDSRYSTAVGGLGFVSASHIIGPARLVLFSSRGASLLSIWAWRSDRFLKVVE
jgi:signal peptidase I